jgi:hypothetical protein
LLSKLEEHSPGTDKQGADDPMQAERFPEDKIRNQQTKHGADLT